jgi:hypothetical protein
MAIIIGELGSEFSESRKKIFGQVRKTLKVVSTFWGTPLFRPNATLDTFGI